MSPRTRNVPRPSAWSLRLYWSETSLRSSSSRSTNPPLTSTWQFALYVSGEPRPKMHDTEATITTSRRANSDAVAAWRSRSISWLIAESFSM